MSKYEKYTSDQVEELLSTFLIDSWSFSKVQCFANNEKAFEMRYLYYMNEKKSASSIAGNAYHKALASRFEALKNGEELDLVTLERIAFDYIDSVEADKWRIQKTNPTIEDCITNAKKDASKLLNNFMQESNVYDSEIKEIIAIELFLTKWLTVNGVDIPMPCNVIIDEVIETIDGKIVIIDHKSKRSFTDEKELQFTMGKQAITYVLAYEKETGKRVDEVWFMENKISTNRDKSAQIIPLKVKIDNETRMLYEIMLYEPLKRMIEAVSDADYVYMINDNDNLIDKAELYEFWTTTMLSEVDDFNVPENKKPLIKERLRKIRDTSVAGISPHIVKNFKKNISQFVSYDLTNKDMKNEEKIEHILSKFGISTKVAHIFKGYSSDSYLLEVSAGIKISSVQKYHLDIANALNLRDVRISKDLYVYDDKSYLLIECSKKSTQILYFDKTKITSKKIPLGEDNFKNTIYWDLENNSTPHMLVCGSTGSGKTVSLKSTINYASEIGINDIYVLDPKNDFSEYKNKKGITVLNSIEDIELQIGLLVAEMEDRVKNNAFKYTLVIFDEYADAFANSRKGNSLKNYKEIQIGNYANGNQKFKRECTSIDKSLEENMSLLLQKGRSLGFRMIAATQRSSVKIINGDSKVNYTTQMCFRVPKEVDSKVVIDEGGAESLNGNGDCIIESPEYLNTIRFQAYFNKCE